MAGVELPNPHGLEEIKQKSFTKRVALIRRSSPSSWLSPVWGRMIGEDSYPEKNRAIRYLNNTSKARMKEDFDQRLF